VVTGDHSNTSYPLGIFRRGQTLIPVAQRDPHSLVEPDTFVIWATTAQHTRHLGYMASKCRSVHRNAPLRVRKVKMKRTCTKGIDLCTRVAELPMHLVSRRTRPSQKKAEGNPGLVGHDYNRQPR
jgi:hypothetical protein